MIKFSKVFILGMLLASVGLTACASVDRSTASDKDDAHVYKPLGLDRYAP